jgi:hypothetical protein
MMKTIRCTTQEEFDEAIESGAKDIDIVLAGNGYFYVSGSAQVRATGSAQVTAYDSAQVRATGSAQVTAYGSAQVTATKYVAITVHGDKIKVIGGVRVDIPAIETATQWCEFYGVGIKRGVAELYKAVRDDYLSAHGCSYAPGTKPEAEDWDGGEKECGGGLHFSPRPFMALAYDGSATKFVACGVKVSEIAVHKNADYPDKVKAPRVVRACVEVDIDGNPVSE